MSDPPLLVFLCTGNICRSPMAAAIAADLGRRQKIDLRVASAGTSAWSGEAAMDYAGASVAEIGLSLDGHRAQALDREMLERATLVVGVSDRHRDRVRHQVPQFAKKIVSFNDLTGLGDIPDPVGGGPAGYDVVRDLLVRGMPAILNALVELNR